MAGGLFLPVFGVGEDDDHAGRKFFQHLPGAGRVISPGVESCRTKTGMMDRSVVK